MDEKGFEPTADSSLLGRLRMNLNEEIDVPNATIPLTFLCAITGFMDAIAFTAAFIWPAFQTGNTVQLGIAAARSFSPGSIGYPDGNVFERSDQLALCSLLAFNIGAGFSRLSPWAYKTKGFVVVSMLVQALVTVGAALTAHYCGQSSFGNSRGDPSWTNPLGFVTLGLISAAMGAQGVIGTKLGSQYATTVVLTSLYCALAVEPTLLDPRKWLQPVKARDHKLIAILMLIIGGFVSRALIGQIGSAGTLGIGAGLRVLCAMIWMITKTKKVDGPKAVG